ncbi:hypothetical protein K435DRAFT_701862 [Dendrothele bispora CBS 962.96]|uniref:C2H2-type domain-containing protein n=1 Tax=Dendrothele bispora (strain CBS 962.96) TaxID=1314807 RepID=A0A4S8KQ29_DENBC|nr:hypothetical protein K435DRAFT_701862 [Dendrothele bispora CBS 962.96]
MSGSGNGPGSPTSPPQSSGVRVVKPTIGSEAAQEAAHRRRNSDSKSSHKCSLCGRGLTAKHNLDNHINSHYGIKKYRCPYCDQASGTRHVLKRHALKKHPGQPI